MGEREGDRIEEREREYKIEEKERESESGRAYVKDRWRNGERVKSIRGERIEEREWRERERERGEEIIRHRERPTASSTLSLTGSRGHESGNT